MVSHHIASAFDADMKTLHSMILTMGGRVEAAIEEAVKALDTRDDELAATVVRADQRIDDLEEEVNAAVVRMLALRQPVAQDLREAITVMKVAADLERLGDYAKNLAKRVSVLTQSPAIEGATGAVRRQARLVRLMLKDALEAYARNDPERARDVIERDPEVDHMTNALFREFLTRMMEDPRSITACMHFLFIAKNVERMGDHVTEICEQVIFVATGERPGSRPKGDSTSSISPEGLEG